MAVLKPRIPSRGRFALQGEQPEQRPDLLLYALSLMILTNVWRVQDLFPVLGVLRLNLVATALTIALLVADRDPARHLSRSPILVCVLAILTLAILGVPVSLWPRQSATLVVRHFLPNLVLMVLVAAIVRGPRDLYRLGMVNLVGACGYSIYVQLNFEVGTAGRLNHLIYYDSNDLALVLVCTIPFAIFFFLSEGWRYRLLALASLMLLLVTLARTGSRGGFVGLVGILGYVLVGYRAIPPRVRLVAAAGVLGLLAIAGSEAYWDALRTLRDPQQDYNWAGRSAEGRMEVWRRGLRYMAADPVLGVGIGSFPQAEGMLSEESRARAERGAGFKWSVAHNTFLEVGVELGLIALALFVATLAIAFRVLRTIRSIRPLEDAKVRRVVAFACTLMASLVGFIVSGFFISATYFSFLYVLLGLTMGFAKLQTRGQLRSLEWSGWRSRVAASRLAAVASGVHPARVSSAPRSAALTPPR